MCVTSDLVSGLAVVHLVSVVERGPLLFGTTGGLRCLETTASCVQSDLSWVQVLSVCVNLNFVPGAFLHSPL